MPRRDKVSRSTKEALLLFFVLLTAYTLRITDAIEHGLHWSSQPAIDTGALYHTADLFQTWAWRILLTIPFWQFFRRSTKQLFFWLLFFTGVWLADQAIWQMVLNLVASGSPISGELTSASFTLFGFELSSHKLFRNSWRIGQLIIGASIASGTYFGKIKQDFRHV